jgi:hypothetical protein
VADKQNDIKGIITLLEEMFINTFDNYIIKPHLYISLRTIDNFEYKNNGKCFYLNNNKMLIKKENSFYIYDIITQIQEEKLNVPYKGYIKFIDVLKGNNRDVYVLLTNECNIIFFNKLNIIFTI